jgi:ElaB/YqjD/DUF883 family membrane-anchored ribosome-binding protein
MAGRNGADLAAERQREQGDNRKPAAGAEGRLPDFARMAERLLQDKAGRLKAQSREAAVVANDQMETARRYVVERVNERPFTTTLSVLGAGILIGILFAGRRR